VKRRLLILVAALVAAVTFSALPSAAQAGDNAAIAINTKDGSSVFKLAFAIRRVAGDVVDETNGAVAYASCTSCQTTAIAIEIVLVTGDPSTVTPTNVAVAVNESCNLCDTFASAYQFVVSVDGPVHFTPEGLHELRDIRKELRDLKGLSNDEIRARLPGLMARLKTVLQTQLVRSRPDEPDQGDEDDSDEPDAGTTTGGGETTPGETTREQETLSTPTTTTETTETQTDTEPVTTTTGP
jgi:putative peptide zinc metalloprotease protein